MGLMDKAFKWAESNAVPLEDAYPYTSGTGTRGSCQTDLAADGKVTVSSYTDVTKNDAAQLKAALDKQPVSVAIEAVKNAWGASWGDAGYVKLGVESTEAAGVCGILSG